jgi:hypothetical protein
LFKKVKNKTKKFQWNNAFNYKNAKKDKNHLCNEFFSEQYKKLKISNSFKKKVLKIKLFKTHFQTIEFNYSKKAKKYILQKTFLNVLFYFLLLKAYSKGRPSNL